MEENKKKKKSVVDSTVVLSFVVAIFAIVSLIAFGVNQVSFAADPTIPSNFTFKFDDSYYLNYSTEASAGSTTLVDIINDEYGNMLYCIEQNVGISDADVNYSSEGEIPSTNAVLIYLLAEGEDYLRSLGMTNNDAIRWIVQSAIWVYMAEANNNAAPHTLPDAEAIKGATKIYKHPMEGGFDVGTASEVTLGISGKTPGGLVTELINKAKTNNTGLFHLEVNSGEVTRTGNNEGDYRCLITVRSSGNNLRYYKANVESTITGVYMSDGTTTFDSNHEFSSGDSFYVYVPEDKVPEGTTNISVSVTGVFDDYDGNIYSGVEPSTNDPLQKVVTARRIPKSVNSGASFEIQKAPDTSMNKVQTIYFIGLIVLLCGVGIIYANAKPVEAKQ